MFFNVVYASDDPCLPPTSMRLLPVHHYLKTTIEVVVKSLDNDLEYSREFTENKPYFELKLNPGKYSVTEVPVIPEVENQAYIYQSYLSYYEFTLNDDGSIAKDEDASWSWVINAGKGVSDLIEVVNYIDKETILSYSDLIQDIAFDEEQVKKVAVEIDGSALKITNFAHRYFEEQQESQVQE